MNIITIGYAVEGSTDVRFMGNIIRRTFEELAFDCSGLIEVYEPQLIRMGKSDFVRDAMDAAKQAEQRGLMVLCLHADADSADDETTFTNKINPAISAIQASRDVLCKNLVAVVPVQMTEAWILADPATLILELGTGLNEQDLGLIRQPESVAQPKETIKEAIRLAQEGLTQRQRSRQPGIGELYLPLGQKIDLRKLDQLSSYRKFKEEVRKAYVKLGYLY